MEILVWLLAGAMAGGVTGLYLRETYGIFANIAVGICGAVVAGSIFQNTTVGTQSVWGLAVALAGSAVLLMVVNVVHRSARLNHIA